MAGPVRETLLLAVLALIMGCTGNRTAQYKWKQCVLRLELTNLLNQRSYAYTLFDGINTYTYDYALSAYY